MEEKNLEIINTILKNSISKNEVKKISRIENWYKEINYSEDVYSAYINYFDKPAKPELGLFMFKYLLSTDKLRQLRSLLTIDKGYQKYIEQSSLSFLSILIQFVNYSEHWNEILKSTVKTEKDKNKDFIMNNLDLLFNNYKPLESILGILFKIYPINYWFGNLEKQKELKNKTLKFIIKDKEYFKSNKNSIFNNIEVFADCILERKDSSLIGEELKCFFNLFQFYNKDFSFLNLEEISKNTKEEELNDFLNAMEKDQSLSINKKNEINKEILKIKSLKEKEEIKSIIVCDHFKSNKKRM